MDHPICLTTDRAAVDNGDDVVEFWANVPRDREPISTASGRITSLGRLCSSDPISPGSKSMELLDWEACCPGAAGVGRLIFRPFR